MSRLAAALYLVGCLACPAQGILGLLSGGNDRNRTTIETAYRKAKGAKLGVYLATKYAGKKVLVLLPPEMPRMPDEGESIPSYKAVLDGLKKGIAGKLTIVGQVEPKMPADVKTKLAAAMGQGGPEDMAMMPEAQLWFNVPALNKELAPYKGKYDLLVCLTCLPGVDMMPTIGGRKPVPVTELSIMSDDKVKLVLGEGGVWKFGPMIQVRKVVAAVTYRRDIREEAYEQMPPKGLDAAFAMRYVLITPENLTKYKPYFQR